MSFVLTSDKISTCAEKGGKKTFSVEIADGKARICIYYDFKEQPLCLTNCKEFSVGDLFEIVYFDHIISFYINGYLNDEEWPYGTRLYSDGDQLIGDKIDIKFESAVYEKEKEPSVVGEFTDAEGWRPGDGIFVGDCMPATIDDRYHVFYLKDRRHHGSKWGLGGHKYGHVSTADFKTWQIHPVAAEVTEPWQGSICTGCHIKKGKVDYLFYTYRMYDISATKVYRSISYDGYHYEKDESFSYTLSDKYHSPTARDPKVFLGEDGLFHMLVVTSLNCQEGGCLAHLISPDLDTWEEAPDPMYIDWEQCDCPDYVKFNGFYYLIFSRRSRGCYLVSDKPFGPWRMPKDQTIKTGCVPKCDVFDGKLIFTSFKSEGPYGTTFTFKTAVSTDGEGNLIFEE